MITAATGINVHVVRTKHHTRLHMAAYRHVPQHLLDTMLQRGPVHRPKRQLVITQQRVHALRQRVRVVLSTVPPVQAAVRLYQQVITPQGATVAVIYVRVSHSVLLVRTAAVVYHTAVRRAHTGQQQG